MSVYTYIYIYTYYVCIAQMITTISYNAIHWNVRHQLYFIIDMVTFNRNKFDLLCVMKHIKHIFTEKLKKNIAININIQQAGEYWVLCTYFMTDISL